MKTKAFLLAACISFLALNSVTTSAQWVQSSFPTNNLVTDMMFYGKILYVATYNSGIYQSQDFATWTPSNTGISTSNIREVISAIEGSYITYYAATDAGVFRSAMMGYNWTAVNNGLTNLNVQTVFSDGTNLFAGTTGGAFRSENYGQSWSPVAIGTASQVVQCFFKNGTDLLAGLSGVGNYLYRSTDNGQTWAPYGTGLGEVNNLGKLSDELFAGSYTLLYHSTDNGATWTQVGPGLPPGLPVTGLASASDYLWISTFGGGYIQHTDSTNFRKITAGMLQGGTNLSAVAVNDEWIVFGTIDNGIWYEPVDVITGTDEGLITDEGFAIYPNPTRGKFQIAKNKTQTNHKLQIQNCKVVDVYGNVLFDKVCDLNFGTCLEFGACDLGFDISRCPAGIYFIRISLENQMIVKKIIKL